ncbi:MAG TPA: ribonuclease P protein component, partial [Myxococcales bacterium]|nr:ribonuclease P protein component [Myxococcales bacterium]
MARPDRRTFSFPRSARLLRRSDYDLLQRRGRRFAEGPLAANWISRTEGGAPPGMGRGAARVGIAVSSKVGQAVVRNRVKRRLREAIRHELALLPPVDLVLIARASATR